MASTSNIASKYRNTIGHIEGLAGIRPAALDRSLAWCLDNSVFSGRFNIDDWGSRLESLRAYIDTCLFVVVPDMVGDAAATIARFHEHKHIPRGYPLAFVSQDGIKDFANDIPWNEFSCLFVGGSDTHKLGCEGGWIVNEARKRGKWVHIGRVNSPKRLLQFWRADSWDGTTTSYQPSNVIKLHHAVLQARAMKAQKGLL